MAKSQAELEHEKKVVGEFAAHWVPDGAQIGIGSGTTLAYFIGALGARIRREGLRISGVATSVTSERLARAEGIPLIEPQRGLLLDFAVDGADEISPELNLIKGGGGKLFREKLVAMNSKFLLAIADSTKTVPRLGKAPLPVEVVPTAMPWVMDRIAALGAEPVLRVRDGRPFETDQANHILDCYFHEITEPQRIGDELHRIAGVLEHGLFLNIARLALVADASNINLLRPNQPSVPATNFPSMPPLQ